jgi:hypothetical protein
MNRVTKTLLNVMRIEVLLGIGLVLWALSVEVRAEEKCPYLQKELRSLIIKASELEEYKLLRALNRCGTSEVTQSDRQLISSAYKVLNQKNKSLEKDYSPVRHPAFSVDVKIIACEPVKYSNRETPTYYWYAIDMNRSKGWQITQETYRWSDAYELEKTPNFLIIKKKYGDLIKINRKTLRTVHFEPSASACQLSSLEAISQKAIDDASTNTI